MKTLPLPLRRAAEELLGRSLNNDEVLRVFIFRDSEPVWELSPDAWEQEMNELIDSFPQSPLLSGEDISRDRI